MEKIKLSDEQPIILLDKYSATTRPGIAYIVETGAVTVWVQYGGRRMPVGVFAEGSVIPSIGQLHVEALYTVQRAVIVPTRQIVLDPRRVQRMLDATVVSMYKDVERVHFWIGELFSQPLLLVDGVLPFHAGAIGKLAGVAPPKVRAACDHLTASGVYTTGITPAGGLYLAKSDTAKH